MAAHEDAFERPHPAQDGAAAEVAKIGGDRQADEVGEEPPGREWSTS
jgi:hypothetical protein